MDKFLTWVNQNTQIAIALIGVGGVILGTLLTIIIWPFIRDSFRWLWDKTRSILLRRDFENRFLEWVIREHRFLPILPTTLVPVTEGRVHELDDMYVSLAVTKESAKKGEGLGVGEALHQHSALVLLGDPGAGKTTLLRFLALTFARARRNKPLSKGRKEYQREKASIKEARQRVKSEFRYEDYPLPIFVYLNRLRDITSWSPGRSLLDTLRDDWKSVDNLRDFPVHFFESMIRQGKCIFLFDAFDELSTQAERDKVARYIGELASAAPPGNRFVVSSRIVGYKGQLNRYGFHVLTIQPLSITLVGELVTKWYHALNESTLANDLLNTLKANPRLLELAVNPMLLSLIVLVQYVMRLIPDRRHVIYEECVKILVERRYAPPGVREEYDRVLPGLEAQRILRELALSMHRNRLREVTRIELEQVYLPAILATMPTSRAFGLPGPEVLHNIEQRSQLLVERGYSERGEPVMAFSHLTFQEYFTSLALKEATGRMGEGTVSESLLQNYWADPDWWEEVALLYSAQLDEPERQAFFARLYPLPSERDSETG